MTMKNQQLMYRYSCRMDGRKMLSFMGNMKFPYANKLDVQWRWEDLLQPVTALFERFC